MAGFWKPRRQAETVEADDAGLIGAPVAPDAAALHEDPELAAQLAHLEEIERRHEQLLTADGSAEPDAVEITVREEAWPAAIPALPDPAATAHDAAPLLRWLETALAVLSARASRTRDELQRLGSQWVHITRNLARFRAEEVAAVAESEARVRERVASDETACHLIRLLHAHFAEQEHGPAAAAPLAPADVDMLRRLLDDASADRVRAAQSVVGGVMEELSGLALDVEVVQRQAEHEPAAVAGAVRSLHDRIAGVVEDLRGLPGTELVVAATGEPLHVTLRRALDAHQARTAGDLAWSGTQPADLEVRAAVLWIVQEFLAGVAAAGGAEMRVALSSGPEDVVLRLSALVAPSAFDGGWVLRCRTRAAVAGGTLDVEPGDAPAVVVRFPVTEAPSGV